METEITVPKPKRIGYISSVLALTGMMEMAMHPIVDMSPVYVMQTKGHHSRYQHSVQPRIGPKVGRNEPCSCGSGIKYKHCCGKE